MKKKILVIFLVLSVLFAACRVVELENGQNYYCDEKSYLDITVRDPLEVRFTCAGDRSFEVVFNGPQDQDLIDTLQDNNEEYWMGVVIVDGEVVQIYERVTASGFISHWKE